MPADPSAFVDRLGLARRCLVLEKVHGAIAESRASSEPRGRERNDSPAAALERAAEARYRAFASIAKARVPQAAIQFGKVGQITGQTRRH